MCVARKTYALLILENPSFVENPTSKVQNPLTQLSHTEHSELPRSFVRLSFKGGGSRKSGDINCTVILLFLHANCIPGSLTSLA